MNDTQLRMGIIGAGLMAAWKHGPAIRDGDRTSLAAVCRRDPKRLQVIKERLGAPEAYTDWREMLETSELDAVVISTPHDLHAEPTIAALERGLHVLVEKPLAITSGDAKAMVAASTDAERILMVAYNDRFGGLWRTAKEALQSGAIGQVRQVSAQVSTYRRYFWEEKIVPASWREKLPSWTSMPEAFFQWDLSADWRSSRERTGGGTMANFGAHGLNLALWLAGSQPAEVAAFAAPEGQDVEYFVCIASRLANDVQLSVTFADAAEGSAQLRFMVMGDDGVLLYDQTDGTVRIAKGGETEELTSRYEDISPVEAFAACVLDGTPNLSPAEDAANAVYLTEASYQAAATHQVWRP